MRTQESLSLPDGFELAHPSPPYPGRLMRLFCPIFFILLGTMKSSRDQLTMGNAITAQLVRNDLSGLTIIRS